VFALGVMTISSTAFGGGALTALGLRHPLGPIATFGSMAIATLDVHGGHPIWATEAGAELPITNMAATAVSLSGPGAFALNHAQRRERP